MRTTLTIEPDVARKLQRRMAQTRPSLEQIVNDALRIGLAETRHTARSRKFRVKPHACGFFPGIDRDRVNHRPTGG